MPTFEPLNPEGPPVDAAELERRLKLQQLIIGKLVSDSVGGLTGRVMDQEDDLADVYKPLVHLTGDRVKDQGRLLKEATVPLADRLRSNVAEQQSAITSVLGELSEPQRAAMLSPSDPAVDTLGTFVPLDCPPGYYNVLGPDGYVCKRIDPPPPVDGAVCPPGTFGTPPDCYADDPPPVIPDMMPPRPPPVTPPVTPPPPGGCPPGTIWDGKFCVPKLPEPPPPNPTCLPGDTYFYTLIDQSAQSTKPPFQWSEGRTYYRTAREAYDAVPGCENKPTWDATRTQDETKEAPADIFYCERIAPVEKYVLAKYTISKNKCAGGTLPPPPSMPGFDGCYRISPCDATPPPAPPKPPEPPPTSDPSKPPPAPPKEWKPGTGKGWDNPNRCVEQAKQPTMAAQSLSEGMQAVCTAVGQVAKNGISEASKDRPLFGWFAALADVPVQILPMLCGPLSAAFDKIAETFPSEQRPEWSMIGGHAFTLGIAGWLERVTSIPMTDLTMSVRYTLNNLMPVMLPQQGDMDLMFLTDAINDEQWECWTKALNNLPNSHRMARDARRTRPTVDQVMVHWLRWRTDRTTLDKELRTYGILDPADRDKLVKVYQQLPPPSDAIRFALRDVFDPAKLGVAEMRAEYEQQVGLKEMLAAVGIEKTKVKTAAGREMEFDIPFLYWISSYEEISPTQGFEMLHRLRPGRVERWAVTNPDGTRRVPEPVTMREIDKLLKEKDYNPIWRTRLAAIAYRPVGRIDLKRFYKLGVIDADEMTEGFEDMGYAKPDAELQTKATVAEVETSQRLKLQQLARTTACQMYNAGAINRDGAVKMMTDPGMPRWQAEAFIADCDRRGRLAMLKEAIAGVKGLFTRYRIDRDAAVSRLIAAGVARETAEAKVEKWSIGIMQCQDGATLSEAIKWFRERQITASELFDIARCAGRSPTAARRIVRSAELGELARTAREREREQKARDRAEAQQRTRDERLAKEARAAQEKRLVRFLALETEANLKKWLKSERITPAEVRATFNARGHSPADIERWIAEATAAEPAGNGKP